MGGRRYKKRQLVPVQNQQPIPQPGIAMQINAQHFSGPIPPPNILEQYNAIIPDGANRILVMAEKQSAHRETLESQVVAGNVQSQKRGSLYAFIICMTALLCGTAIIIEGKSAAGLATIITALAGLVGTSVYSSKSQRREREEKSTALQERRRN